MQPTFVGKAISEELSSIFSALVAGARYGAKIRLPHAFVMTFLFRRDLATSEKVKNVFNLVLEHASNLSAFAAIYKAILSVLKLGSRKLLKNTSSEGKYKHGIMVALGRTIMSVLLHGPFPGEQALQVATNLKPAGHPERAHHALIAGSIGGYLVWGRYSSVNYQVVLYLASRVIVGLWKRTMPTDSTGAFVASHPRLYPVAAAAVWGVVMMLFEDSPTVLHPSLKKSMDEIYRYSFSSQDTNVGTTDIATT